MTSLLEIDQVSKIYPGTEPVVAVDNVSLKIEEKNFVALIGPSGSGKTSLLNIASGLDTSSKGRVLINGTALDQMTPNDMCDFRNQNLGFVFQAYNLIPTLKIVENVEYTLLIRGEKTSSAREKALHALQQVGLEGKAFYFPSQLSGGQQQRAAVARALASQPKIVFADEPTANLDKKTAHDLIDLFWTLNRQHGMTFVFSTHDTKLVDKVLTQVHMSSGRIESIITQKPEDLKK